MMMFLRSSSQTTTCYWVSILVQDSLVIGMCSGSGRTLRRASWLGRGAPGDSPPELEEAGRGMRPIFSSPAQGFPACEESREKLQWRFTTSQAYGPISFF